MTRKQLVSYAMISSIPCAAISMIYCWLPAPFNGLLWCIYVGFCTTYLVPEEKRKIRNIYPSYLIGIIWGLAYWYFYTPMIQLFGNGGAAMFFDVWIITALIMVVHIGFIMKKFTNILPLLFPMVFIIFENGGDFGKYPYMVLTIIIGSLTALLDEWFASKLMQKLRLW